MGSTRGCGSAIETTVLLSERMRVLVENTACCTKTFFPTENGFLKDENKEPATAGVASKHVLISASNAARRYVQIALGLKSSDARLPDRIAAFEPNKSALLPILVLSNNLSVDFHYLSRDQGEPQTCVNAARILASLKQVAGDQRQT